MRDGRERGREEERMEERDGGVESRDGDSRAI